MKIYSWNVNGIRSVLNKGELGAFMDTYQPDILCLQETKAERHQANADFPGYQQYWNSSKTKKGYSGTAIFSTTEPLSISEDIPAKFAQAAGLDADEYGNANAEGRVIAAEYGDFYVVTAYTPNAKNDLSRLPLRQQWDAALTAYCKALADGAVPSRPAKPVVYCGDMNVAHTEDDLANPKPNRGKKGFTDEERSGFDDWLAAGFVDTLRMFRQGNGHYTWWSHYANSRARNVGWRIDYFLVSEALRDRVQAAEIHAEQMGSDHCPVSITLRA